MYRNFVCDDGDRPGAGHHRSKISPRTCLSSSGRDLSGHVFKAEGWCEGGDQKSNQPLSNNESDCIKSLYLRPAPIPPGSLSPRAASAEFRPRTKRCWLRLFFLITTESHQAPDAGY